MATCLKEQMRTADCTKCGWTGFVDTLLNEWRTKCPDGCETEDRTPESLRPLLHIPFDAELFNDLNVERYELGKTGKIQSHHPTGTHDDRFWALALAVYAVENPPEQTDRKKDDHQLKTHVKTHNNKCSIIIKSKRIYRFTDAFIRNTSNTSENKSSPPAHHRLSHRSLVLIRYSHRFNRCRPPTWAYLRYSDAADISMDANLDAHTSCASPHKTDAQARIESHFFFLPAQGAPRGPMTTNSGLSPSPSAPRNWHRGITRGEPRPSE